MKKFLILAVLMTASVTGQVEHAPTVAQCQADQRLWLATIEESKDSERNPAFLVLTKWDREMTDCEKVDPDNRVKYYCTGAEIAALREVRLLNFLARHDLFPKFIEEDAAGKR